MINKALRILIADPQHFHRMKVERLFNGLDYYRVKPRGPKMLQIEFDQQVDRDDEGHVHVTNLD